MSPRTFSFRPALTFVGRRGEGVRGWAGKPTHPPLTDFPVAAYVLAAGFDVLSLAVGGSLKHDFFAAATFVMTAGLLLSVLAAVTGFLDWRTTPARSQVRRTASAHAAVMSAVTVLVLTVLVLRALHWPGSGGSGNLITGLSVLSAILVTAGAAIGGSLVYDHGLRVELIQDRPSWQPSDYDLLPNGTPVGAVRSRHRFHLN